MVAIVRAEPKKKKKKSELETPARSSMWVTGSKYLGQHLLSSQAHEQGAGEAGQTSRNQTGT